MRTESRSLLLTIAGLMAAVALAACSSMNEGAGKPTNVGTVLLFSETQPGTTEAAPVRMFINDYFIRIDESGTPGDFILFDRKAGSIRNVVAENKTIFVIEKKPVKVSAPIDIEYTVEKQASSALMKRRDAMKAFHYRHLANGKSCYSTVSIKEYLPDAVQAFREFRRVLAGEHSKTMSNIPGEEYDACDLALNIFHAEKHLDHGFPVREWDERGYQRFLVDVHENVQIPAEMLQIPEGYKPFSVN